MEQKESAADSSLRLVMVFGSRGLSGYFIPENRSLPVERVSSHATGPDVNLLEYIENAVYDHPELIDDIPAQILVSTPYHLLFPEDTSEDDMLTLAADVFGLDAEDIFVEEYIPGVFSVFGLCKGFRSFILRTFPGIDVQHISRPIAKKGVVSTSSDEEKILVSVREDGADFLAFRGRALLHGSSREVSARGDIIYYSFKIWNECGFNPSAATIWLDAPKELRDDILPMLRRHINYARILAAPTVNETITMPLPVALAYRQQRS